MVYDSVSFQVIKLYAWEIPFQQQVMGVRKDELDVLKASAYLNAAASFTWTCAPFLVSVCVYPTVHSSLSQFLHPSVTSLSPSHSPHLSHVSLVFFCFSLPPSNTLKHIYKYNVQIQCTHVPISIFSPLPLPHTPPVQVSLATFATYSLVNLNDPDNRLTPDKAFVALSLFNILRFPLAMLPMLISNLVQVQNVYYAYNYVYILVCESRQGRIITVFQTEHCSYPVCSLCTCFNER